jgi:mono/diheme cytochrome c family protein
MHALPILAIALLLPVQSGAAQAASDLKAGDVETGRHLAERLCATCHLNPGQGEKSGPEGIPGFRAVAKRPNQRAEDIISWLESVPPMMPNHHLSRDEMVALSQFIMSLRDAQ